MRSIMRRSHPIFSLAAASLIAMTAVGGIAGGATALAQAGSVFQGTLMEPNQKTAEVTTDELRQILKDGSAGLAVDSLGDLQHAGIGNSAGGFNDRISMQNKSRWSCAVEIRGESAGGCRQT